MLLYLAFAAAGVLLCGIILCLFGAWLRGRVGLPAGAVVFSDTGYERVPGVSLVSHKLRLVGKPDFLIRGKEGLIPVEEKSSLAPIGGPYWSQLVQLGAYLILVEENYGRVPFGVLKYKDRSVRVEFTEELRRRVLGLLSDLKRAEGMVVDGVLRSHNSASKCRQCGFSDVCVRKVA